MTHTSFSVGTSTKLGSYPGRSYVLAPDEKGAMKVVADCRGNEARAAFIVKACNSHEALMEVATLLDKLDADEGLSPAALWHVRELARTALRQAA